MPEKLAELAGAAEAPVAAVDGWHGTRAPGDLEDQAARYHPGRHELTIARTSERSPTWAH